MPRNSLPRHGVTVLVLGVVAFLCLGFLSGVPAVSEGQQETTVHVLGATPDVVHADEDLTIEYTATGPNVADSDVEIVFTHPSGETKTFDGSTGESIEQEIPLSSQELRPGPYDVTVQIADGPADTMEKAFEIPLQYEPSDASFSPTASSAGDATATYRGVAGDFVEVSVSLSGADEGFILFGGNRGPDESGAEPPFDILHVSGSTTFLINTRLVGTDRPSEDVYIGTGGSVTSYAHDLGPESEPSGVFSDIRFENKEYETVADTLAEFRGKGGLTPQVRPLQPGYYSLVIGSGDSFILNEDGIPDPRYPLDRARIQLTKPTFGNVTTYSVPTGNANEVEFQPEGTQELTSGNIGSVVGMAKEADTITIGDRVLVEVSMNGTWGALLDTVGSGSALGGGGELGVMNGSQLASFFARPEGISFWLEHTNSDANKKPVQFDLANADPDDLAVILDPSYTNPLEMGTFYLLIDTREPSAFSPELEGGEQFRLRMSYESDLGERYRFSSSGLGDLPSPFEPVTEQFPYFNGRETTVTRTTSFGFEERFLEYDRTAANGDPVVTNSSRATISGTTNFMSGSNLPLKIIVDVRHRPIKVESSELSIAEDGSFSTQLDLSAIDAGADVDIQFRAYQELLDERSLNVVASDDATSSFDISRFTANSIVRRNETFVDLSATVTNTGLLAGTETVELLMDGSVVANRTVELDPDESKTFNFQNATAGMEPGEYAVEVRTSDDRVGKLVVIEQADSFFDVASLRANATLTADGTAVDFSTTIANTGVVNGTEIVELLVDGDTVTQRPVGLPVGGSETFAAEETFSDLGPGTHVVTVVTPDDSDSVEVTVTGSSPTFNVTALNATTTLQQGGTLDVTSTIRNTGTVAGNGTVTLRLANTSLDDRVVDLGPGNETGFAVENYTVERAPGEYPLTLATPHDERTVTLVVEGTNGTDGDQNDDSDTGDEDENDDGDTGGEDGNDAGSDDDTDGEDAAQDESVSENSSQEDDDDGSGSGAGFLGLGVGGRAVVGGTAVVGAVHVLGYWA